MENIEYLLGNRERLEAMSQFPGREPFTPEILEFCNVVSKELMRSPQGKGYPDIVALGFWLRKGSTEALKRKYIVKDGNIRIGQGIVFHVAPSNVPVNFAYSLFVGLLCGNANVVRVPSKDFPQVTIIIDTIQKVIKEYPDIASYICLVRYGHEQSINDFFSALCDVRIIWGGDRTIAEIRKSQLQPRATEITFADRFSLAVIDVAAYCMLGEQEKEKLAQDFYNDTYLTDQNACTSPKLVVWINGGEKNNTVKERTEFWSRLWNIVEQKYSFQDIQGVNKLTKVYLLAADGEVCVKERRFVDKADNRMVCVEIDRLSDKLLDYFDNAGYFIEFETDDILDLAVLCNNKRCQTIGYLGEYDMLIPLLRSGVKGIDRVVPIGKTMDFDLVWDGYNLAERLVRIIRN